jgi:hypothetical protein
MQINYLSFHINRSILGKVLLNIAVCNTLRFFQGSNSLLISENIRIHGLCF